MSNEEAKSIVTNAQNEFNQLTPEEKDNYRCEYDALGVSFPSGARETYKCPIYFENEGANTGSSFFLPGENPYEEGLKFNNTVYKFRSIIEPTDKQIIAAQYNACIAEIIYNKMMSEFIINARSVTFGGIINLIRPFVVNDINFVHRYPENGFPSNIYECIMNRMPYEYRGTIRVENYSNNAPITYTTTMFTTLGPDGKPKYIEGEESVSKTMEYVQAYSVKLTGYYKDIIDNIIMPNIFTDKFADAYIKGIGENPDKYSPGDKHAYVQSILLEQAANDYKKIIELYEFSAMNAFTLFSKLKAPESSIVNIDALRKASFIIDGKVPLEDIDYVEY